MTPPGLIVDGHLDLAFLAMTGRDLTGSLTDLRASMAPEQPLVTFAELREAGIGLALGTLFAAPAGEQEVGSPLAYTDAQEAHEQAMWQLDQYRRWQDAGLVRLLCSGAEVTAHAEHWTPESPLGLVVLMEGADPVRRPDEVRWWYDQGVRLIGPAWRGTRYAGGTGVPGPLTPEGVELLHAMREANMALDVSHLAEESFWQAVELQPRVVASHSNARARIPGDRHLSDDMARAVAQRGGLVGVVLLNAFIQAGWDTTQPRLPWSALAEHVRHYGELLGWDHVALGSDLDGGFDVTKVPAGMERVSDVSALFELVPQEHRAAVRSGNWLRWLSAL